MRAGTGAAALLLAAALGVARAQPIAADDAILLDIPDCAGVAAESVRAIVAIEVAPRPVLAPGSAGVATTRGTLECAGATARIVVEEEQRPEPLRLEIALAELAPAARPRLLALAIAELIATSRLGTPQPTAAEVASRRPAAEVPEPVEPVEAEAPLGPAVPPSLQLWLALAAVREADPPVLAPAVALGAVQSWDQLAITFDLRYERGRRTEPGVRLGYDAVSLAVGPAWRVHGRSYQLLLGAALRLGYASLSGSPRSDAVDGDSVAGLWLGPCAQGVLQFQLSERWGVRVGAEVGYVARGVRGVGVMGEPLLELEGVWAAGVLGVSFEVWRGR